MNIEYTLFFFFASFALLSSLMVIGLTNAVHSVLFLILVFCNVCGILLLLGAEFFSFLLLIVYVGAIAVLFLFVIMMLNVKTSTHRLSLWSTLPIGVIIFFIIVFQFTSNIDLNFISIKSVDFYNTAWNNWVTQNENMENVKVIGKFLYTKYCFVFIVSGCILLIAMIGAIVLTMHQRANVKKQLITVQLNRESFGVLKFITLRK